MKILSIARDFSEYPGARDRSDGPYSGEEFLEEVLDPIFTECLESKMSLQVDLDGTNGYATSFLDQAFGELAKKHGTDVVLAILNIKSDDEPDLIAEVEGYIRDAHSS